jgi:hypothetical protein
VASTGLEPVFQSCEGSDITLPGPREPLTLGVTFGVNHPAVQDMHLAKGDLTFKTANLLSRHSSNPHLREHYHCQEPGLEALASQESAKGQKNGTFGGTEGVGLGMVRQAVCEIR